MTMKEWINAVLDLSLIFSFDHSGFKRHCADLLEAVDLQGRHGMITGASSGIGLAVAKALLQQGMSCKLISRDVEKLKSHFTSHHSLSSAQFSSLDMSHLKQVYSFAVEEEKTPIDLLVHNAGSMPSQLTMTPEGFEQMFASQVLGPFILTKTLAGLGKLRSGCRIIFVSSGGMYLKKLDLSDLAFEKSAYSKYSGYANAKRAQVILNELFSTKYSKYLFSSMHPGWVDTPGVQSSMPLFKKLFNKRLRTVEEGADTILWLATTLQYPNGKFWFDRKEAKTTILRFNKSNETEKELLWEYCESLLTSIKENRKKEEVKKNFD